MSFSQKIKQAAVLAYRFDDHQPQALLITSRGRGRWVLPKGHIEPNQTPVEAAEIEAFEEAGVKGITAETHIGKYTYQKQDEPADVVYSVKVFPMRVTEVADVWPESEERKRSWKDFLSAANAIEEPELSKLIHEFGEMLSEMSNAQGAIKL